MIKISENTFHWLCIFVVIIGLGIAGEMDAQDAELAERYRETTNG